MAKSEREYPRYAHEAAVTIHAGGKRIEGRTQNVSRGGLCANLADPIAMGSDVEIDLVLVFDDHVQSDALRMPARVVWCTSVDDAHQVGFRFRPLDAQRVQHLATFLGFLDRERAEKAPRDLPVDDRFR